MSTGVIGQTTPISKVVTALRPHIPLANRTLGHGFTSWDAGARAFMTTATKSMKKHEKQIRGFPNAQCQVVHLASIFEFPAAVPGHAVVLPSRSLGFFLRFGDYDL
jgi:hypothetical protein